MKIPFDFEFFEESRNADSDPEAAARGLLVVAKRLREGRELKPDILNFLAGGIERAMAKPQKERGPALLREFKLTYGGRRPSKVSWIDVGRAFEQLTASGKKRSEAIGEIADTYKIDESTVVRFLVTYKEVDEENDRCRDEFDAKYGEHPDN
jgi:hypothetical protein